MFRGKILAIVISIFALTFGALPVQAASIAGTACTKLNSVKISQGTKFTCIKSGKKLLWNKGIPATSGVKPTPEATPVPSFKEPERPTSFTNISSKASSIEYWAWKLANENIKKSQSKNFTENVFTGPNTKPTITDPKAIFEKSTKLFPNSEIPKIVNVIIYNFDDVNWAQKKFESFYKITLSDERKDRAYNNCRTKESCEGASLDITPDHQAIILMTVERENFQNGYMKTNGETYTHEYVHTLMNAQMEKVDNGQSQAACWFWEGVATYAQVASIHNSSSAEYSTYKSKLVDQLYRDKSLNEAWYLDFLSSTSGDYRYWQKYEHWRLYDVGMHVAEILVAVKGVDPLLQVFGYIGDGLTFDQAFEKTYGEKWSTLLPEIAKTIQKMTKG